MQDIEINDEFKVALELMDVPGRHVFITGKAGTGKSTLLQYFRSTTKKNVVVLAPTGVAAVNVAGQTIHSFFKFKPDITADKIKKLPADKRELIQQLDAIIIDEVSMVRADLMDCIDKSLRLNGRKKKLPFGGVKLILVGDLYQLPPVVMSRERELFQDRYQSPYFFSADCIHGGIESGGARLEMVELEKIYRQKDDRFIRILNAIRSNTVEDDELSELNQRVGAVLPELKKGQGGFAVTLVPTNAQALEINLICLERLRGRPLRLDAQIEGDFDRSSYPADVDVRIKKGAQVMLLNNDSMGRWVNGSMGEVIKIKQGEHWPLVFVRLENGEEVDVGPNKWDMFRYTWDAETRSIDSEAAGSFVQHPIKLAWAVTIHKSQGKTFDRVVIDMGRGAFAHGQTYVALSRARTLDGITLKTPIKKTHVLTDWRVVKFMVSFQCTRSEEAMSFDNKVAMIRTAINEKKALQIIYLKGNGEKSRRKVWPRSVGEEFYKGVAYPGMSALCDFRQEDRMFRVDRILKMDLLEI